MVKKKKVLNTKDLLGNIHTVSGVCPECEEDTVLVSIVTDYYRCTNCGHDTRQYVNGSIKYLKLNKEDIQWLKNQR
jgi:uncharacterized protein (DUF983 family)